MWPRRCGHAGDLLKRLDQSGLRLSYRAAAVEAEDVGSSTVDQEGGEQWRDEKDLIAAELGFVAAAIALAWVVMVTGCATRDHRPPDGSAVILALT